MLLQISSSDTLTKISTSGGQTLYLVLFLILIVGIFIIWLITKSSRTIKTEGSSGKLKSYNSSEDKKENVGNDIYTNDKTTQSKSKNEIKTKDERIKTGKQELSSLEVVTTEDVKYIGYTPTMKFEQKIPFHYPIVIMPEPNCFIKYSQKGRTRQKGFTETKFKTYLETYFKNPLELSDNDFILIKESYRPYEPDFTLINEKNGINIFIDIEIDEPYEGLNVIANRKLTHYQDSDSNRDTALKTRGWITIRFAELQIYQEPKSCCLFIAELLEEIDPRFAIHEELKNALKINSIKQWTIEEAEKMSKESYREKYLGILNFNNQISDSNALEIRETKSGSLVEERIKEKKTDNLLTQNVESLKNSQNVIKMIESTIDVGGSVFYSFNYEGKETIVWAREVNSGVLKGICLIENTYQYFDILKINSLVIKNITNYYKYMVDGHLDLDYIRNKIQGDKYVKIYPSDYIRIYNWYECWSWSLKDFSVEDIEVKKRCTQESDMPPDRGLTMKVEKFSLTSPDQRLITELKLNKNFLCAYCYRRKEMRVYYLYNIRKWQILNL